MQKNSNKRVKAVKRLIWKFILKQAKNSAYKHAVVNILVELKQHFKQKGAWPLLYTHYQKTSKLNECVFNALLYSKGYSLQYNADKSFDILIVKARKKVKNRKKD